MSYSLDFTEKKISPSVNINIPITDSNSNIIDHTRTMPQLFKYRRNNLYVDSLRNKKNIPVKACIASVGLNILGVLLLGFSLDFFIKNKNHSGSLPMLILSILAFTPGIYSGVLIIGVILGWKNYNIESIPSYEIL